MPAVAISAARTETGRFASGHSGNPAGRPKGARNKATLAVEALLDENGPDLMRKLIDASLGGDVRSARFLVGRLCPANADQPITLDIEPGQERDLLAVHAATVRALCDGEITPKEALTVARVLAVGAKLIRLRRALKKEARAAASPSSARRGAEKGRRPPAGQGPKRPLSNVPPRAGQGERPLSRLYFGKVAETSKRPLANPAGTDTTCRGFLAPSVTPAKAPMTEREICLGDSPDLLPQAGQGEERPVSGLYFAAAKARAPLSELHSSTALRGGGSVWLPRAA